MGRAKPPRVTGVALIDKPTGCTSHDVVQQLRSRFRQRQVGHTGTLDPAASGLMVVTLGRATRIARFLEMTDKAYIGQVRIGIRTTTWDAEGEVVETKLPEALDQLVVKNVLSELVGPFEQTVPAFSAIKVDGERLHARARRGEVVEGPKRSVHIHELELLTIDGFDLHIRAVVSKGTYIRSLAMEIGRQLGYPAHLAQLRRTRVGPHDVKEAYNPESFGDEGAPIMTASEALKHLPAIRLDREQSLDVAYGRRPRKIVMTAPLVRFLDPSGALIALAHPIGGKDPAEGGVRQFEFDVVLVRPEDLQGTI